MAIPISNLTKSSTKSSTSNSQPLISSSNVANPKVAKSNDLLQAKVATFLSDKQAVNQQPLHLLIAYSGGLDSTVLLHILHSLKDKLHLNLSAMHVHHGLSPNADDWAEFCINTCLKLTVPLQVSHVQIPIDHALGLEAAARQLRYAALFKTCADYVCLAQHQDDQAETLLLQLARGAGVKGLSAMAAVDTERKLLRPLLAVPRADLLAYAQQNQLRWIEDESNQNTAFDRNFMRLEVLPMLQTRYPAIAETLSRSAIHLAEAAKLLDELATIDAQDHLHGNQLSNQLSIAKLQTLSASRATNLLRWWLAERKQSMPSTAQLAQILKQLTSAKLDAQIQIVLASNNHQVVTIRRYQGKAYLVVLPANKPSNFNQLWQGEASLILPDNSRLIFTEQLGAGLAINRLNSQTLRISYRLGGERFKPDANRPTRTLKHLLQEANMPPWQREWLPLIYVDEKLVIVPNLCVDAELQAQPNEMGLMVDWQPAQLQQDK